MKSATTASVNYRKIYESHYGPIQVGYEIHHIDGDRSNNSITNLMLVTTREHYDIHYAQGDWGACKLLALRLKLSPEESHALAKKHANNRLAAGTHNFTSLTHRNNNSRIQQRIQQELVTTGKHKWLGPETNKEKVKNGTHPFVGGEIQRRRVADGSHNFLHLTDESIKKAVTTRTQNGSYASTGRTNSKIQKQRCLDGTSHLVTNNPSKTRVCCIICRQETNINALGRKKHDHT